MISGIANNQRPYMQGLENIPTNQANASTANFEPLNESNISALNILPEIAPRNINANPYVPQENLVNSNLNLPPQPPPIINPQNPQNNIINDDFDEQFFKEWFIDLLISVNLWHILGILLFCYFIWKISFLYSLIALSTYDLFEFGFLIWKLKKNKNLKKKKRFLCYMFESLISLLFQAMAFIYFFFQPFLLVYLVIPIGLNCFLRCIVYSFNKDDADCNTVVDFLTIGFRLFLTIQFITICLRLDSLITWEWKEVFWTYWVLFSILVGINFGMFIMIISKVCQSLLAEIERYELKGLLWFFLLAVDFTIGSCLLIISLIEELDEQNEERFTVTFYYFTSSLILNNLIPFLIKKDLIIFLKSITANDNVESDDHHLPRESAKDKPKKSSKREENIIIPKFLMKFSSTYFKRANESQIPKVANSIQSNPKKKNNAKTKVKKNFFNQISSERSCQKKNDDNSLGLEKGRPYQNFNEQSDITRNSLMNSKDTIPTYLNNEISEEKRKNLMVRSKKNMEIINFKNENKINEIKDPSSCLHQFDEDNNIKLNLNDVNLQNVQNNQNVYSFKETIQNQTITQPFRNIFKNTNSYIISSARLPETQKILNSFRDISQEANNLDPKMSATSNKASVTCLICFDKLPDAVFMECGHGGICYDCSLELWKSTGECYLCRNKIQQVLQVDLKYKNGDYIRVLSSTQMVIEERPDVDEDIYNY